jgi:hypothetical protein
MTWASATDRSTPAAEKNSMISLASDRPRSNLSGAFLGNFWETGYRIPKNGGFGGVPKGIRTPVTAVKGHFN